MTDTPFPTYAFPGSFFPTPRTMPDRIRDVFNVKEFGAFGDNISGPSGHDDRAAIQLAMQKAADNGGGIVFFPRGNYYVGSKLVAPGDSTVDQGQEIHLVGSGGNAAQCGSRIWTDKRDYVLYIGHGTVGGAAHQRPNAIRRIQDLNFQNTYCNTEAAYIASVAQTSTEPPSSVNYVDGTPGDPGAEGHGCLYLGNIYRASIQHCGIIFGTGIGICMISGYGMEIICSDILGGFPHGSSDPGAFTNLYKSIGLWHRAGAFRGSRTEGCGTAIVVTDGPAQIENIDIENSGNGIICGAKPLKSWSPELLDVRPVDDQARFQYSHIRSLGMEKIINIGVWVKTGGNATFNAIHMAGGGLGAAACQYLLKVDGGMNHLFQGFEIGGYVGTAAVDIRGANGCTFRNIAPNNSGPGVPWLLKRDWTGFPVAYGNILELCDQTDGGVLFTELPPGAAGRYYSHTLVCTDSTLPRFSSGVSNVGKTIVGGGSNKVGAKWDGTSWTIA